MDFFFNPNGIAVIGATDNPFKGGYHILNNILGGYKGKVYPVNPKYDSILGLPCYPDIESIPDDFDLAIYFIPASFLPAAIKQCGSKKVKGIIIESAGFAEVGKEGAKLQQECIRLARKHQIRLWGPNCMGLLDGHTKNVFSFMYSDDWKTLMTPGKASFVVQSGMLSAGFLLMILERGGMSISKMCSIGNKCDVNETELLEYLADDPHTDVIGLYLESIVEPRRFMEISRSTDKPIVVLKGGRSPSGAKAAMSHTASLAGNDTITNNALKQAGVITVHDFSEMTDFIRGFSMTKSSRNSGGTAIVSFSGGGGIVTTDFLHDFDLPLARLSDETLSAIKEVFPPWMEPANPVDVWPAVERNGTEAVYNAVADVIMHDENVDSLIIHLFSGSMDTEMLRPLAKMKDRLEKPVIAWLIGTGDRFRIIRKEVEEMDIPVFEEIGRGVSFLAAAKKHYHRKSQLHQHTP
jgi:acyl-CoA synthetase (NDP forming)